MEKLTSKPVFIILLLTIISSCFFFSGLDGIALTDPDETFYAQTAKEMLERGEWLTPYLYGKPQFEKPILFYWALELSFKIFKVNEFAARFPSAMFGFMGLIAMYLLGRLLFNNRTGIIAAVILATNVEYVILSRACITDMALFFFMLLGSLFFFYGYLRARPVFYVLSSMAFGLAVLTKGPVFVALPLVTILVFLAASKDLKALKKLPYLWCIAGFVIVTAPWYLVMYKIHGAPFIDTFFGFHNVTRFLESEHKIGSQVYYNIPVIMGGFFPWSAFLPFGLWRAYKNAFSAGHPEKTGAVFALAWFVVFFLFFTASSTKLPTYIFPVFLSAALMTAAGWDRLVDARPAPGTIKAMSLSYYLMITVIVLGSIGALIYVKIDEPALFSGVLVTCSILILGIIPSLIAFTGRKYLWAFCLVVYALAILLYPVKRLVLSQIEPYETSKEVSQVLSFVMNEGEKVGAESRFMEGIAFYTGKYPVNLDKHHDLVQFISSDERGWCVMKDKNHRELYELETKPYCLKPSYMIFKVGKRSIVTNTMPDDGIYMLKRERKQ